MREKKDEMPSLGMGEATDILEAVFRECGARPNSVPMEALSAYTIYRKERFGLQRSFLLAMLALFFLLPFLFIDSRYTVRVEPAGERKLPVYVIEVDSFLPVWRVTAWLKGQQLPVYEAGPRTFTVEPTRNGQMQVDVALLNRQNTTTVVEVADVDNQGPVLVDSEVADGEVRLYVEDEDTGARLDQAYGIMSRPLAEDRGGDGQSRGASKGAGADASETPAGADAAAPAAGSGEGGVQIAADTRVEPLRVDADKGLVVFAYPEADMDVFIPDYIGNILHLALKVQER